MGMAAPTRTHDYVHIMLCESKGTYDTENPKHQERFLDLVQLLIDNFHECERISGWMMDSEGLTPEILDEIRRDVVNPPRHNEQFCGYEYYVHSPSDAFRTKLAAHEMKWTLAL